MEKQAFSAHPSVEQVGQEEGAGAVYCAGEDEAAVRGRSEKRRRALNISSVFKGGKNKTFFLMFKISFFPHKIMLQLDNCASARKCLPF